LIVIIHLHRIIKDQIYMSLERRSGVFLEIWSAHEGLPQLMVERLLRPKITPLRKCQPWVRVIKPHSPPSCRLDRQTLLGIGEGQLSFCGIAVCWSYDVAERAVVRCGSERGTVQKARFRPSRFGFCPFSRSYTFHLMTPLRVIIRDVAIVKTDLPDGLEPNARTPREGVSSNLKYLLLWPFHILNCGRSNNASRRRLRRLLPSVIYCNLRLRLPHSSIKSLEA